MSSIITEQDLKLEAQIVRCKMTIREYFKGQQLKIDYDALYRKLDPPSLLFQFAHLIAFHKYNWKDALLWVMNNKNNILAYAEGKLDEWGNLIVQASDAAAKTDGKPD